MVRLLFTQNRLVPQYFVPVMESLYSPEVLGLKIVCPEAFVASISSFLFSRSLYNSTFRFFMAVPSVSVIVMVSGFFGIGRSGDTLIFGGFPSTRSILSELTTSPSPIFTSSAFAVCMPHSRERVSQFQSFDSTSSLSQPGVIDEKFTSSTENMRYMLHVSPLNLATSLNALFNLGDVGSTSRSITLAASTTEINSSSKQPTAKNRVFILICYVLKKHP